MDIVQLEYWNDLTGECPWAMSTESMDIAHGLSGHCPCTQWTLSMDSVDIVQSVSGLFPHTLFRAMHCEGMHMFNLQCLPFLFITCNACRYMSINTDRHSLKDLCLKEQSLC